MSPKSQPTYGKLAPLLKQKDLGNDIQTLLPHKCLVKMQKSFEEDVENFVDGTIPNLYHDCHNHW
jgi:PHP family Zn ribbon phosphoesterase